MSEANSHKQPRKICGARRKRDGQPCQVTALMPNGRCRVHGGMVPTGPALPQWKHGRHSKWNPPINISAKYQEALNDADLLNMRHEIALLDARIAILIDGFGESPATWGKLAELWTEFRAAVQTGNKENQATAMQALDRAIRAGSSDTAVWGQIVALFEQRRKLVKDERDHLIKSKEMTTIEQLWAIQTMQLQELRNILLRRLDRGEAFEILRELSDQSKRLVVQPAE